MSQQGDVIVFQTNDDGDILVVNGVVEMTGGFETAVYLSLFGGNEDDDGRVDSGETWWGNLDELDTAEKYVSRLQNLLQALPATSANLRRVEEAARLDLQWFLDRGIASVTDVLASIPGLNRLQLDVSIQAVGEESSFTFVENWKAAAQ